MKTRGLGEGDQRETSRSEEAQKKFFYESFAGKFDARMNMYDCTRRLEIVFDDFFGSEDLRGRLLLDAGCVTGHFSRAASERGAQVVSVDVGPGLLGEVKKKYSTIA